MTKFTQFEEQINSTLEEHIEELNEVKLRSLESFASVEELKSRSERNLTFSERSKGSVEFRKTCYVILT